MASNNAIATSLRALAEAANDDIVQHDLQTLADAIGDIHSDKFLYAPCANPSTLHGFPEETRRVDPEGILRGLAVPVSAVDGEPERYSWRVAGEGQYAKEGEAEAVRDAWRR